MLKFQSNSFKNKYIIELEDKLVVHFRMLTIGNYCFRCTINEKLTIARNVYNCGSYSVY